MGRRDVTRRRVDRKRLKWFMELHDFKTQSEFAQYCGISEKSLRRMLSEGSAPITVCYAVAVAFGRSFNDIFGPDDSEDLVLWRMCLEA